MHDKSSMTGLRLFAAVLILGALAGVVGPRAASAHSNAQTADLLANPGFEPFTTEDGKYDYPLFVTPEGGGHIAEGWSAWWYNDEGPTYSAPEYDIAPIYRDPYRVHSGNAAQHIFRPSTLWMAGIYQRVAVPANANLQFTIWGHAWASFCRANPHAGEVGEPDVLCDPRNSYEDAVNPATMKVGIDPTGGTDWASPNVVWSQDYAIYDVYQQLTVSARARGSAVTVFTFTTFVFAAPVNNVYWDDAALVVSGGTSPAPGAPTGQVLEANTVVNVRAGPSTSYGILGQIRPGARYTVLGQSGGWYRIDFNGQTGYVYGPLTTVTTGTVPAIPPGQGVEATTPLNVRSGPGTGFGIIGTIRPGAVYRMVSQQPGWYQIDYNGRLGWVSASYVVVH
jgi:uncharacterized protein YraI